MNLSIIENLYARFGNVDDLPEEDNKKILNGEAEALD